MNGKGQAMHSVHSRGRTYVGLRVGSESDARGEGVRFCEQIDSSRDHHRASGSVVRNTSAPAHVLVRSSTYPIAWRRMVPTVGSPRW